MGCQLGYFGVGWGGGGVESGEGTLNIFSRREMYGPPQISELGSCH